MPLTLGEKLRQAREARGISISEVAEQTRISALYLESIENNDYRPLPGGIFNKGFLKSYAKYIGVDEKEALQDYNQLLAEHGEMSEEGKVYNPEVLTDDHNRTSLLPTLIFAVVILGLMVWGILALLKYYNNNQNQPVVNTNTKRGENTNLQATADSSIVNPTQAIPLTGEMKVEFKALKSPVALTSISDGQKAYATISPSKSAAFEPKQTLILSYSKNQASNVQMTINGKQINLPSQPADPKRNPIELNITKETVSQIYQSGVIAAAPQVTNATKKAPHP